MGNFTSHRRSRNGTHRNHPSEPPQQHDIPENRYVFTATTPYTQYPNPDPNQPQYYHYPPGYYAPPHPVVPFHEHAPLVHHQTDQEIPNPPVAFVEHQKAVTIRNDVNIKKDTVRIERDEENDKQFLVAFTFDAIVAGSVTVIFFAKEGEDCSLIAMKETVLKPVTVHFEQGIGQKFRQPSGTGIDFSMFDENELVKHVDMNVYPLAVKAESADPESMNCQVTQAVFEMDKGGFRVKLLKQILWVNGMRYELQEIYGIGNSVDDEFDGNNPGKECVICLSEPSDTTVLPCRHMCMCSGCAKVLRYQTNRCPICRNPVERLLEIRVSNGSEE